MTYDPATLAVLKWTSAIDHVLSILSP